MGSICQETTVAALQKVLTDKCRIWGGRWIEITTGFIGIFHIVF